MNGLWPSGVATLALKYPGHVGGKPSIPSNPDRWGSSGARRASDVEMGTGASSSVRASAFGRDTFFLDGVK